MTRSLALGLATLTGIVAFAVTPPAALARESGVRFENGAVIVQLFGVPDGVSYVGARADSPDGLYAPVMADEALCTGTCALVDYDLEAGRTYYYRFTLRAPGEPVEVSPAIAVTVPADAAAKVAARAWPNPGRGDTNVELRLAGRFDAPALPVRAVLFDASGRRVRTLHDGPLSRGATRLRFDGRDELGRRTGPGNYFLRVSTPLGSCVTRIVRTR